MSDEEEQEAQYRAPAEQASRAVPPVTTQCAHWEANYMGRSRYSGQKCPCIDAVQSGEFLAVCNPVRRALSYHAYRM